MSLCINPVCPSLNHPHNDENRFCKSCGSQLELLGRYRVMRLLSDKTGFSRVYEASEQDTPKVLKVLKEDFLNDTQVVELFWQEADVLGQTKHPNIPKVDGYFQYQTRNDLVLHCIAMEKIDGINLEQWLKQQNRPISQEQAVTWLKQLTTVLELLHNREYLHRDIKPSNILIQPDGRLVLVGFGNIREVTKTYSTHLNHSNKAEIIPLDYSTLEQMSGQTLPQSDFFALGRTFVFLLTGNHPLDMYNVRHNLLHWRSYATHVSPLLLDLIDWLMASEIKARPANAQEILQFIEKIAQSEIENNHINNHKVDSSKVKESPLSIVKNEIHDQQSEKMPLLAFFAALIVSLGVLSIAATDYLKFTLLSTATQPPERKGKIDYFPYQEGRDSQGRIAEFNIAVLSVEYKWLLGSNFQIKYNDKVISLEVLKLNLEQEGIQQIMQEPNEIISVGTASCEDNVVLAQRRALERSKQTQILAKKLFVNTPSIKGYRLLNLGKFQRIGCQVNQDLTTYQRNAIIIGVKKKSANVILDEALRDRLEQHPFADFRLEDYSLGSAEMFKTIQSN